MSDAVSTAPHSCPVCSGPLPSGIRLGILRLVLKWIAKEQRPLTLLDPDKGNSSVYELPDCDRVRRQFLLDEKGKGFKGLIEGQLIWVPKQRKKP